MPISWKPSTHPGDRHAPACSARYTRAGPRRSRRAAGRGLGEARWRDRPGTRRVGRRPELRHRGSRGRGGLRPRRLPSSDLLVRRELRLPHGGRHADRGRKPSVGAGRHGPARRTHVCRYDQRRFGSRSLLQGHVRSGGGRRPRCLAPHLPGQGLPASAEGGARSARGGRLHAGVGRGPDGRRSRGTAARLRRPDGGPPLFRATGRPGAGAGRCPGLSRRRGGTARSVQPAGLSP